jgi:hypothetical protein
MTKANIHETMFNKKQVNIPLFHHNKVDCATNREPFGVNIYFQVIFMVFQIRRSLV